MTIEEKAKEYVRKEIIPKLGNTIILSPIINAAIMMQSESSFTTGAEWMLVKAMDWLQYHVNDYLFDDGTPERPWLKCSACMFDAFKKAMEE